MNNFIVFPISLSFVILLAVGQNLNYCDPTLCNGRTHIACGNSGQFSGTCDSDRKLIDILPFQEMIVDRHNDYRNRIAGGHINGFLSASQMATMQWDDELAYLAALNVKTCKFARDSCHNTPAYLSSGQNLAWRWAVPAPDVNVTLNNAITGWFHEFENATMDTITNYQERVYSTNHFAVMVADSNTRVGCAVLEQTEGIGRELYIACNYATSNKDGFPVYETGTATSGCLKGINPEYTALCSTSEEIDPNDLVTAEYSSDS